MSVPKPACQNVAAWVRVRLGRDCFAPFTGQDVAAFQAWTHLLHLYFRSDFEGRALAVDAMSSVLHAMQPSCLPVAKAAIPAVGDWCHEEEVWAQVGPAAS